MTIIVVTLFVPVMVFVTRRDPAGETAWVLVPFLWLAGTFGGGMFVYEWTQIATWGRTLGKRIAGVRVTALDGAGSPSPAQVAGRAILSGGLVGLVFIPPFLLFLPPFIMLNYLWQLWDRPYQQCLHDKAARTIVVSVRKPETRPGPYDRVPWAQ